MAARFKDNSLIGKRGIIQMQVVKQEDCTNAYTNHLSQVNQFQKVIASNDIYNAQGMLLIKKGNVLNKNAAHKIIQFKLQQPLEDNVAIENCIDGSQLFKRIMNDINGNEDYLAIHQSLDIEDELKNICRIYNSYPVLVQKMTVLSIQLPKVFSGGLFAAYVGLALANILKMSSEKRIAIFIAGLLHDVGMLHIDPEIVKKEGQYTPEEWRAMQAHTIIGEKALSRIPKLPKIVTRSILEHHERTDGSGYPRGLVGADLSLEGQIVGMSDSLFAIYTNKLHKQGRSFKEVISIIQMNNSVHFYQVFQAVVQLMRQAKIPDKRTINNEDIPNLIDKLLQESKHLLEFYNIGKEVIKKLPRECEFKHLNMAMRIIDRIYITTDSSGLLCNEYQEWLLGVKEKESVSEYIEIERAELVHAEFHWQILQLSRAFHLAISEHNNMDSEFKETIKTWLVKFHRLEALRKKEERLNHL